MPRVFRPHHFSRPVTESELSTFPYKDLSEYTRFQQYIQLDTLDAPPLYSTALRMVQEKNYDSIPELLKISRQLREKYGKSPLGRDIYLALLANDTAYFKTADPKEYSFGNISFGASTELGIAIEKALNTARLEDALKNFPSDIQKNFRRNWERYQAEKTQEALIASKSKSTAKNEPCGPLFYLYFGGEAQLLRNGAQKVFKSDFQMGLNWMGIGGCFGGGPFCMDYEVTFFYSRKTGEDHVVNDTLYNRENGDVRMSLLLEWRPYYTPYFDVRAYVGYHWNAYSFHIDSDYDVDKNHQYNNIGDFADFSFGGMLNFSPFDLDIDVSDEGWKIYAGFRLKVGYIFLNTPEFNNLNGGGFTTGFYMYVGI